MPRQEGLRPIGDSIKKIIEKIKAEREAKRNRNKPIRTQPKLPGLKKGGVMKRRKARKFGEPFGKRPKKQGAPQSPALPYGEKPPQLKKSKKERREKYRKEVQKHGGNVIYADEWDKIDPGLKKGIGLKKGGVKKAFGGQLMRQPTADQTLNVMKQNATQKLGMKKGGSAAMKRPSRPRPQGPHMWVRDKDKHAGGGISGKSTVGELRKKYGPLKKGIRLKGKGSSFMKEYKKRVYGRAKGGSMVQGPMKRARGSGAAIKGTRFQGTF